MYNATIKKRKKFIQDWNRGQYTVEQMMEMYDYKDRRRFMSELSYCRQQGVYVRSGRTWLSDTEIIRLCSKDITFESLMREMGSHSREATRKRLKKISKLRRRGSKIVREYLERNRRPSAVPSRKQTAEEKAAAMRKRVEALGEDTRKSILSSYRKGVSYDINAQLHDVPVSRIKEVVRMSKQQG